MFVHVIFLSICASLFSSAILVTWRLAVEASRTKLIQTHSKSHKLLKAIFLCRLVCRRLFNFVEFCLLLFIVSMLTLCVYYELSKSANPAATKHLKQRACMKIHELNFTNHVQSS